MSTAGYTDGTIDKEGSQHVAPRGRARALAQKRFASRRGAFACTREHEIATFFHKSRRRRRQAVCVQFVQAQHRARCTDTPE